MVCQIAHDLNKKKIGKISTAWPGYLGWYFASTALPWNYSMLVASLSQGDPEEGKERLRASWKWSSLKKVKDSIEEDWKNAYKKVEKGLLKSWIRLEEGWKCYWKKI